jgi:hypothetical protein
LFGVVRGDTWNVDVLTPFDPSAAPRHVTVKLGPRSSVTGDIVPVLADPESSPVELLLRADDQRVSLGKSPSRTPIPFPYNQGISIAVQLEPEHLVALDANHSVIVLIRGGAAQMVLPIPRVADPDRSRLTLARIKKTDKGGATVALALVSITSGDILLADLDLGLGRIGLLRPAGNLGALDVPSACRADKTSYRLLADVTVDLQLEPEGADLDGPYLPATALIAASPSGHACLEGLEVRLAPQNSSLTVREGAAVLRGSGTAPIRAVCGSR